MRRGTIDGGVFATVLVLLTLAVGCRAPEQDVDPALATSPGTDPSASSVHEGLLYGRVTTEDGATYEGRLRWGGDEEALWGSYFNGSKDENLWAAQVPTERLPTERVSIGAFGIEIAGWLGQRNLGRPFMARYGDIERIEQSGRDLLVTLKSGTLFTLDLWASDDLGDGVRVWDSSRGVVDLAERSIRTIELLPAVPLGAAPDPLHGTVRTQQGEFTGLVEWNRVQYLGADELYARSTEGQVSPRFDAIRSIERGPGEGSLITLLDGREIVLPGTRANRGLYVDDPRYGRVLISWDAFERVDFSPGGTGPAYDDFPPGSPLTGSVITRSGRSLAGRLVFDLDESETTETLDAPSGGVDYTIPFGLVASIVPAGLDGRDSQHARVTLHSGEELQLEPTGDLGEGNAGMLIFSDGAQRPEYVPWTDVEQVDFERPAAMYPPSGPQ